MADLTFLDSRHPIWASHEAAWKREEKRHAGGDAVLDELVAFAYEETSSHTDRKKWARWLNFARLHTTVLSGHLRRAAPIPNFGPQMGEVRARAELTGQPSLAELFYYNCDGVGNDGSQLPAYMDGVEQRALATGFRWLMVEMPSAETLEAIRVRNGRGTREGAEPARSTDEDVRQGFRPFLVEYSPIQVTNWRFRDGVLVWAVIRIPVESEKDFDTSKPIGDGFYLLVRKGYTGLGEDFKQGGWWKYDAQKAPLGTGTWDDTDGQIPMWLHLGEPGTGTTERPSIGQSATMELGQISADLMNAQSEQRFNARQAAKSINYFLGINKESHEKVTVQQAAGSISVGVEPVMAQDGSVVIPIIWNSSEGVLSTEVYKTIIDSGIAEAKELMVRQITAGANASGERVEADHAEHTAPMLSRIAATAEQSWNTMLYFVAKRFGVPRPTASIQLPREYKLRDVMEDIDALLVTLDTLPGGGSATLKRALVLRKADESDLVPEKERAAIVGELDEAAEVARLGVLEARATAMNALIAADAIAEEAAKEVGFSPADARRLFGAVEQEPEEGQRPPVERVA